MKEQNITCMKFLAIILFLAFPITIVAQEQYIINGMIKVNPKYNSFFEGATLKIKDTDIKTYVGNNGMFDLKLSTQEMKKELQIYISEQKIIKIKLKKLEFWSVDIDEFTIYFHVSKTTIASPDSDADGIPDDEDPCPEYPGSGCADSDGDGVPDSYDMCPDIFGEKSNNGCPLEAVGSVNEIKIFPIPYPIPSAVYSIPWSEINIQGEKSFKNVDEKLSQALSKCAYHEKSYYIIPHGFAIITEMEQIQEDGVSLKEPERWSNKLSKPNDFFDYIKSLVNAPEGHFRVIVFLVTDVDLTTSRHTINRAQARELAEDGYVILPRTLLNREPFTSNHSVTALIYQFKKVQGKEPELDKVLPGKVHLTKSGLARSLR